LNHQRRASALRLNRPASEAAVVCAEATPAAIIHNVNAATLVFLMAPFPSVESYTRITTSARGARVDCGEPTEKQQRSQGKPHQIINCVNC
jgi:hypothetical protein